MLSRSELRARLEDLETEGASGQAVEIETLRAIEPSARYWAERVRHPAPLRRLAKMFRCAGQQDQALALLQAGHAIDPLDLWTAVGLSAALDSAGQTTRALKILEPLLEQPQPKVAVLARAAVLARKLGDPQRCLAWRRQAAQQDPGQLAALISELTAAGHSAEALLQVRKAAASKPNDPELAFRCYVALRKFAPNDGQICRVVDWLTATAANRNEESAWRARVHRWEGDFEEALAAISNAVRERPNDAQLVRERASIALACGCWGRDAGMLLDGQNVAANMPEVRAKIDLADDLLKAFGGSLQMAAANPTAFAHVKTPESVFEDIVDKVPPHCGAWEGRRGIAMIAPSLAAGGAERILAAFFRRIGRDARFGWAKLYLCDLSAETGRDFYLPLTGLSRADVVVLNRDGPLRPPLSWLPAGKARIAQSICEQLQRDRPAILHASLEPLNILAGLAAILTGVPRIVLHTHNMSPPQLKGEDAFITRMRDCYRALLRRPEVSLVCCAEAAARDYREWLGIHEASSIHVVHNGLGTDHVDDPAPMDRSSGLPGADKLFGASAIVGTAFRFAEVKRPQRWVDAAALVLEKEPGCRFIMFGDGDLHASTEEYIRKRGLTEYFVLPGLVSDLYWRLPLLDLFVLSSRSEALPNVLLEAQAAGVPVVAYDVGGVAETMIDGISGILVKEDSAVALADSILEALSNPCWLANASEAGQAFIKTNFTMERMIERLTEILLRGSRSSPAVRPEAAAV